MAYGLEVGTEGLDGIGLVNGSVEAVAADEVGSFRYVASTVYAHKLDIVGGGVDGRGAYLHDLRVLNCNYLDKE